jgi:hypothetical protein
VKTIAKIIEAYGGLEWLRQPGNYIRLENPPYMRLVIEYLGAGPRGMPAISMAHYYEQNGDAMRVPLAAQFHAPVPSTAHLNLADWRRPFLLDGFMMALARNAERCRLEDSFLLSVARSNVPELQH